MIQLSEDHIEKVCQPGKEGCCAFLVMGEHFFCAKESPDLREQIEDRLRRGAMTATGDNCSGPPRFRADPWEV